MKSKKNKINLGTKTRKFYDSFVSFLFNRFNKPKKIIQKGGATADDIKLDFLREVKQNILAQKRSGWNKCDKPDNIVREANKLLKTQKYTVLNNATFIPDALTPELMSWFCGDVSRAPPTIGNLFLNSAGGELTDAELQTAFNLSAPDVAPDVASSSSAAPASSVESPPLVPPPANPVPAATPLTEQQFYMDFRNEIKQIMGDKPCNDETIGEAGKQLMATDKYKNLAKQYEFNESYILQDGAGNFNGDFLRWFCGDSNASPEGGFPTMFIPLRSNAKGILAAYNEAEDVAKPDSEAKVGNGVLGTAGVVVGAVGALGTVGLGTAHYLTKGKPAQSKDTGVDSSATDSVSSNNTDLQNGNDVISPAPPVSSDGTEQQHASTVAESSNGSAPEPVASVNETINVSPTNLPEQTEEQKNQEELEKEVAQEMEQERMEQERLEQKRQEQERMEQALKNPPNGWKKGFSITNGPFSYMTQDGSENWMRTTNKNGLPIWIKTTDKNRSSQETIPDEEFYNRFYPHEPTVKPTIEQSNNKTENSLLLLPPPPPPLVQLPVTNDSSSFGQGGPQIAPRGYTPTYTQVGVGVGLGTVVLGALAYYLYGRKKVNRGASKKQQQATPATAPILPQPEKQQVASTTPILPQPEKQQVASTTPIEPPPEQQQVAATSPSPEDAVQGAQELAIAPPGQPEVASADQSEATTTLSEKVNATPPVPEVDMFETLKTKLDGIEDCNKKESFFKGLLIKSHIPQDIKNRLEKYYNSECNPDYYSDMSEDERLIDWPSPRGQASPRGQFVTTRRQPLAASKATPTTIVPVQQKPVAVENQPRGPPPRGPPPKPIIKTIIPFQSAGQQTTLATPPKAPTSERGERTKDETYGFNLQLLNAATNQTQSEKANNSDDDAGWEPTEYDIAERDRAQKLLVKQEEHAQKRIETEVKNREKEEEHKRKAALFVAKQQAKQQQPISQRETLAETERHRIEREKIRSSLKKRREFVDPDSDGGSRKRKRYTLKSKRKYKKRKTSCKKR